MTQTGEGVAALAAICTSHEDPAVETRVRVGAGICCLLVLAQRGSEAPSLFNLLLLGQVAMQ
jgi:hypothetical protein